MKRPIAVATAVLALGAAGTAVAAPGGGVFGGDREGQEAEFASDLAQELDGVSSTEVEQGLEQLRTEREAEMLDENARRLAAGLGGVSVQQARAALEKARGSLGEGERPDPSKLDAALAEELGVSEDELAEVRQTEAKQHLDQAVEDGAITEKQARKLRKQIESGKMPRGGPHPGGPGGSHGPGGPGGLSGPGGPGGHHGPGGPGGGFAPAPPAG